MMKKLISFFVLLSISAATNAQFNPPQNPSLSVGGGFPPTPGLFVLSWDAPDTTGAAELQGYIIYRNEDSVAFTSMLSYADDDPHHSIR
jgi:hypothetical protein